MLACPSLMIRSFKISKVLMYYKLPAYGPYFIVDETVTINGITRGEAYAACHMFSENATYSYYMWL